MGKKSTDGELKRRRRVPAGTERRTYSERERHLIKAGKLEEAKAANIERHKRR